MVVKYGLWADSSSGRAPRLHRGGGGFESCSVHKIKECFSTLFYYCVCLGFEYEKRESVALTSFKTLCLSRFFECRQDGLEFILYFRITLS